MAKAKPKTGTKAKPKLKPPSKPKAVKSAKTVRKKPASKVPALRTLTQDPLPPEKMKAMYFLAGASMTEGEEPPNDCVWCEIEEDIVVTTRLDDCINNLEGRVIAENQPCMRKDDTRELIPEFHEGIGTLYATPEYHAYVRSQGN
jgi:hypothetical protein